MKYQSLITVAVVVFGVAMSGCASKANYSGDIKDEVPVASVETGGSNVEPSQEPVLSELPDKTAIATGGLLSERRIGFEYDQSVVRNEDLSIISAHSDYLNQNSGQRVILEGHADERGSNEYNLALGQRRADAVRDIMLANGVQSGQIETLSFGEESPRNSAHNEAAWSENRRVEIRYHNE